MIAGITTAATAAAQFIRGPGSCIHHLPTSPRIILLIVNPIAGGDRGEAMGNRFAKELQESGFTVRHLVSDNSNHIDDEHGQSSLQSYLDQRPCSSPHLDRTS